MTPQKKCHTFHRYQKLISLLQEPMNFNVRSYSLQYHGEPTRGHVLSTALLYVQMVTCKRVLCYTPIESQQVFSLRWFTFSPISAKDEATLYSTARVHNMQLYLPKIWFEHLQCVAQLDGFRLSKISADLLYSYSNSSSYSVWKSLR